MSPWPPPAQRSSGRGPFPLTGRGWWHWPLRAQEGDPAGTAGTLSDQRGHKPMTSTHREGEWRTLGRVKAPEGDGRGGWTEAPGGAGASEGAVPGAQMQGPSFKGRGRRLSPMSTESQVGGVLFSGVPTGWPWGSGELAKTPEDSSFKFCLVAQKPLFMNSRGDTGGAPRHGGVWGPPEPCLPLLARGRQTQEPALPAATHCPG